MNTPVPPDRVESTEPQAVAARYARRLPRDARYSLLDRAALAEQQGRVRAWAGLWAAHLAELPDWAITEVGCGDGGNLLDAIRLGARPAHLRGLELLPERVALARERLPAAVRIDAGDALAADIAPASQQAVLQFTVFSSLLGLVLIRIVVVTALSYGLSQYAVEMVVRVLVLELIPLGAALFVGAIVLLVRWVVSSGVAA